MLYYRFLQPADADPDFSRTDIFTITEEDGLTWQYIPCMSNIEAEEIMTMGCFLKYERAHVDSDSSFGIKDTLLDLSSLVRSSKEPVLLELKAGLGFGDLSHVTTHALLTMAAPYLSGRQVFDVGCGSGVLALAALKLGAHFAIALDIDPDALEHTKQNAKLNKFGEDQIVIMHPDECYSPPVDDSIMFVNMIFSQQKKALDSIPILHKSASRWFTSGILIHEEEKYVAECLRRGWFLIEKMYAGDWVMFHWQTGKATDNMAMLQNLEPCGKKNP